MREQNSSTSTKVSGVLTSLTLHVLQERENKKMATVFEQYMTISNDEPSISF